MGGAFLKAKGLNLTSLFMALPSTYTVLLPNDRATRALNWHELVGDALLFVSLPLLFFPSVLLPLGFFAVLGWYAWRCSGALLVIDAGRSRNQVVRRGIETLQHAGVKIYGGALNRLTRQHDSYYYYNYYYDSATEGAKPPAPKKLKA